MDTNLIALSIPAFFALIGVELAVARAQGLRVYRFADSVADLACGIGSQVVVVFFQAALLAGYAWLYARAALWQPPPVGEVALAFLGVDLCYYAWHRASHEVNVLWAVHVVHHQSEEYNLAVALRQAWFSPLTSWPFYLPLAVLGVRPLVFATIQALSTLYQFWIHTRCIGKLGPLEWLFNTPSHHRVHHGRNPKYLDRNHGATLIVWDRLFGTFQEEEEAPVYGTVKPYESWNALWANFAYAAELAAQARGLARPLDRLRVWLATPGWRPGADAQAIRAEAGPLAELDRPVRFDPAYSRARFWWAFANLTLAVIATSAYLFVPLATAPRALAAGLILWTLATVGGLLEGRAWAVPLEVARLALLALALGWRAAS